MENSEIILQKGESIKFLDYTIKNSLNNDGLVLFKESRELTYESHLGNFGEGTKANIDICKRYATIHFMLARPEKFAVTLINRLIRPGSGTMHEFFKFKEVCEVENIKIPNEITCSKDLNFMIRFNDKPLN